MDKFFTSSVIYYDDDLTWCVNRIEPLSFSSKSWYVATKLTWLLSLLIVCAGSVAALFLLKLVKDKYGYLKFDINVLTRQNLYTFSTEVDDSRGIGTFARVGRNKKVWISLSIVIISIISIGWNFMILKIVLQPIPGYQIQTIDELIAHDFRLAGGPFSNVSIWENSKVNYWNCSPVKEYLVKTVFFGIFSSHLQ